LFGSCIIHILYTECAKIKKNNSGVKRLKTIISQLKYKYIYVHHLSNALTRPTNHQCRTVQFVLQCTNMYNQLSCSNSTLHLPPPCHHAPSALQHIAVCHSVQHTAHRTLQGIFYATYKTNTAHGSSMYTGCLQITRTDVIGGRGI